MLNKFNGNKNHFKSKTGLPIATYFSAFKAQWLLENVPEIKKELHNVCFGTMDSFVNHVIKKKNKKIEFFLASYRTLQD